MRAMLRAMDYITLVVGVRELKARASEVIRAVRDTITYRGRPVAVLLPLDSEQEAAALSANYGTAAWDELIRLGAEIGRGWQSPQTSAELLSDIRRQGGVGGMEWKRD